MTAPSGGGNALDDPTRNVLDLVNAAIKRQDDLREMANSYASEIGQLRATYEDKLRQAETARIDAIRAVDVGAVQRAAEVALTQASTLASQVATSAETLRAQVAAAATAATVSLAAALVPIQEAIADLRRAQYEAQGVKANTTDRQASSGLQLAAVGAFVAVVGLVVTLIITLH